jgi:hypothetical protein
VARPARFNFRSNDSSRPPDALRRFALEFGQRSYVPIIRTVELAEESAPSPTAKMRRRWWIVVAALNEERLLFTSDATPTRDAP